MPIIDKLKDYMKTNNLTHKDMAVKLDIHESTFSRWITRKHYPSRLWVKEIERVIS